MYGKLYVIVHLDHLTESRSVPSWLTTCRASWKLQVSQLIPLHHPQREIFVWPKTPNTKSQIEADILILCSYLGYNVSQLAPWIHFASPESIAQIPLGSSRHGHVSTWHDTFNVSSQCILAVSSLSNSTAWHARDDKLNRLDLLVTTFSTGSTRSTCWALHSGCV